MNPACRTNAMHPARPFGAEWFAPFFNDFFAPAPWAGEHPLPSMNVLETETSYTVQLAVPGMTKEDFNINLAADDTLVVRSIRKGGKRDGDEAGKEESGKRRPHYLRREFGCSRFEESFTLPDDVNKEAISATVENGVLAIELPKRSAEDLAKVHRIIDIQ